MVMFVAVAVRYLPLTDSLYLRPFHCSTNDRGLTSITYSAKTLFPALRALLDSIGASSWTDPIDVSG